MRNTLIKLVYRPISRNKVIALLNRYGMIGLLVCMYYNNFNEFNNSELLFRE